MIKCKSLFEINKIEISCKIIAEIFERIHDYVIADCTTKELDKMIHSWIKQKNANPSFLGFKGFPAASCISLNEEVVHGIPGPRKLQEGDIVSIDVGVEKDGFYGDAARTYSVGKISAEKEKLVLVTRASLSNGIRMARTGNRISDISHAVEETVEKEGFSPVRALVGHGVGVAVHEEPQIPNFGKAGRGPEIMEGMVLAIEPMINAGTYEVYTDSDGWTVITEDEQPSAHFEHTIAVVNGEAKILTEL